MITYNTAEQVYSRNHGSERLFKRPYCQTLNYTEGIYDFQKSMNAFWVVDNMVSYMPQILKAYEQNEYEFFVIEICVNKENKGHMEVFTEGYIGNDYNDHIEILKQEIEYIDLPLKDDDDEITTYKFFLSLSALEPLRFTFYLPSEY